jgi:hypothetical protein
MKLPGFERKLRVAIDWTLDLFFARDIVYLRPLHAVRGQPAVSHESTGIVGDACEIGGPSGRGDIPQTRQIRAQSIHSEAILEGTHW